jgi:hypothetical protein
MYGIILITDTLTDGKRLEIEATTAKELNTTDGEANLKSKRKDSKKNSRKKRDQSSSNSNRESSDSYNSSNDIGRKGKFISF